MKASGRNQSVNRVSTSRPTLVKGVTAMSRNLLLQSVLGHLALLAEKHPKKAASPVARRAKRYVNRTLTLQLPQQPRARAA
jgi:hypothetical protein